jgi:hypothetical protein
MASVGSGKEILDVLHRDGKPSSNNIHDIDCVSLLPERK